MISIALETDRYGRHRYPGIELARMQIRVTIGEWSYNLQVAQVQFSFVGSARTRHGLDWQERTVELPESSLEVLTNWCRRARRETRQGEADWEQLLIRLDHPYGGATAAIRGWTQQINTRGPVYTVRLREAAAHVDLTGCTLQGFTSSHTDRVARAEYTSLTFSVPVPDL